MKTITHIPFSEIESIPLLIKDFLAQRLEGTEMLTFSKENFKQKILNKSQNFTEQQREILYKALRKQLSTLQLSTLQEENLNKLKEKRTFTITTGHQLNLFTGPVFFVYKILQTIKTAEVLKVDFPDCNFVPVFWMATEDHDFEEINHFRTQRYFYEIKGDTGGSVGKIKIKDQQFFSVFEKEFKDSVFGTELILYLKEAYTEGSTLSEAIRVLVQRLFADYGLIVIDGDDVELKSEMKSIFQDELLNHSLFEKTKEKVDFLRKKYGKVQVNPREINLFYLSDTRNRIEMQEGGYIIVDKGLRFSEEEMITELKNFPERFSPNALMRPVYQEKVLPNLAYIGGNAEVMYWLELQNYFEEIQLDFPILIPRNSMLFLSEKTFRKIEKLNLKIEDFFGGFAEVIKGSLLNNNELNDVIAEKQKELEHMFLDLEEKSIQTEKTFKNLLMAEKRRQLKSFERMKKRLLKAEKIKESEKLERIEQLFLDIYPNRNWQERVLNFSVFYSDYGKSWLRNCYSEIDVDKSGLNIIQI